MQMHGLRTPNEGVNQRNLKIWADVADKISQIREQMSGPDLYVLTLLSLITVEVGINV